MPSAHLPRLASAAALALLAACGGGGGDGHTINLRYRSTLTATQQEAFEDARDRLERIVTGGLNDVRVEDPETGEPLACGEGADAVDIKETVHGLLILVTVEDLGDGGIIAQSGPCIVRKSNGLPAVSIMVLNTRFADTLTAERLGVVVQHEMFHALGFGTIWPDRGLLAGECSDDSSFTGALALEAAMASNGAPSSWASVPVENTQVCGGGTRDAHWRESVFGDELMTGWIGTASNPLSLTTIRSMADLGFSVDAGQAEAYTIPDPDAALRGALAEPPLHLGDDVLRLTPRRVAD